MERTITVKGTGNITRKADRIVISFLLSTFSVDYSAAIENATEKLERINKAVREAGFGKDELKTSSFEVEAVHDRVKDAYGNYKDKFKGYKCKQRMSLKFDLDMEKLNRAMSATTQADVASDFDIRFTVKNQENISLELLESAARNAQQKAKVLCEAAGAKLGELQSINYNWGEIDIYSDTRVMCCENYLTTGRPSADIEPEDIDFSDTATFVWQIA